MRRTGTHPPRAHAELATPDGRGGGDRPARGRAAGLRVREADGRRRRGRRHDPDRGRRDRTACRCGAARHDIRDHHNSDRDHDSAGRPRSARFDGARTDRHDSHADIHDAVEYHDCSGGEDNHDTVTDHDHTDDDDTATDHDHTDDDDTATDHDHTDDNGTVPDHDDAYDGQDADDSLRRAGCRGVRAAPTLSRGSAGACPETPHAMDDAGPGQHLSRARRPCSEPTQPPPAPPRPAANPQANAGQCPAASRSCTLNASGCTGTATAGGGSAPPTTASVDATPRDSAPSS
jgi:hypothetical protein